FIMKNFDFGTLKYNYVAVHCNSQNKLDNFIKQCEENDIIVGPDREFDKNYGYIIVDSERLYCDYVAALKNEDYDIIEWEIENKIDYDGIYTLMEVINNIKNNEKWISIDTLYTLQSIEKVENCIVFNYDGNMSNKSLTIDINTRFKLAKKDKKVPFEKAMQAYNEYKTIKCIWQKDTFEFDGNERLRLIDIKEEGMLLNLILNGEWYIKEE
ncbi:hypothetical protein, partial [Clostridium botulinum]